MTPSVIERRIQLMNPKAKNKADQQPMNRSGNLFGPPTNL
jgi:hypothetical protein